MNSSVVGARKPLAIITYMHNSCFTTYCEYAYKPSCTKLHSIRENMVSEWVKKKKTKTFNECIFCCPPSTFTIAQCGSHLSNFFLLWTCEFLFNPSACMLFTKPSLNIYDIRLLLRQLCHMKIKRGLHSLARHAIYPSVSMYIQNMPCSSFC